MRFVLTFVSTILLGSIFIAHIAPNPFAAGLMGLPLGLVAAILGYIVLIRDSQ